MNNYWTREKCDFEWYQDTHSTRITQHRAFCNWVAALRTQPDTICEIGCGYGVFYPKYFEQRTYMGMDMHKDAITYCQKNHKRGLFACVDVTTNAHHVSPHNKPISDLVFSSGTIDNTPDMNEFIRAHCRLSRNWVYISAYEGFFPDLANHEYNFNKDERVHYNRISPHEARAVMESMNFSCMVFPSHIGRIGQEFETVLIGRRLV